VFVLDASVLPQVQSFGQKSAKESSLLDTKMPVPRKRTTMLWDRSLEDVIEDDEEQHMSREEALQQHEANQVCMGKENYMERERLEEDTERRLEIFKELVKDYIENTDEGYKDRPGSEQAEPPGTFTFNENHSIGPGAYTDLEGVIASLQDDVADIKKQAEEAHKYIGNLEKQQKAIAWLEKELGKTTTELTKTKEELAMKSKELIKAEGELAKKSKDIQTQMIKLAETSEQLKEAAEKMNTQNERTEVLMDTAEQKDDAIMRLQDLISLFEETIKDY
ncbi:kinesin-like protein KIF20B, partial [Neopsephotus bourkii]|uniref:kinesin-like protein KIF20B n=1 Tax=Neopsephotus bourkii TaxID=309878 RepID=UPI002AA50DC2